MSTKLPPRLGILPFTDSTREEACLPSINFISSPRVLILPPVTHSLGPHSTSELLQFSLTVLAKSVIPGSDHILWFGAYNSFVTLHYLHEHAKLYKVPVTEASGERKIAKRPKKIFQEVLECINSAHVDHASSEKQKVWCLFSGAECFRNKLSLSYSSPSQLWPFLPSKSKLAALENLDIKFVATTNNLETWGEPNYRYLRLERLATTISHNVNYLSYCWEICRQNERIMSLLCLLFPDHISNSFICRLFQSTWPDPQIAKVYSEIFGDFRLIFFNSVRGAHKKTICLDRTFQRYLWDTLPEPMLRRAYSSVNACVAKIQSDDKMSSLAFPFDTLVIEAAMHESWLRRFTQIISPSLQNFYDVDSIRANKMVKYLEEKRIGRIFLNKYQVFSENARYTVYKGRILDVASNGISREVLVKRFKLSDQSLYNEIKSLVCIPPACHANIIQYIRFKEDCNHGYVVLENCSHTLESWIQLIRQNKDESDLAEEKNLNFRLGLLEDVTRGTKYIHEHDIIHTNICPSNIFLARVGSKVVAKLANFELSTVSNEENPDISLSYTRLKDRWTAPESYRQGSAFTKSSDMYSLGCVFYYVLTNGSKLPINAHLVPISRFTFDYIGIKKVMEAMLKYSPAFRITAAQLLEYPIFWHQHPKKYTDFLIQVVMDYGKLEDQRWRSLESIKSGNNWKVVMTDWYPEFENFLNQMKYMPYKESVPWLLKCARNAAVHASDLKEISFGKRYYDFRLDHAKFLRIWFQPFPELFARVWEIHRDSSQNGLIPESVHFRKPWTTKVNRRLEYAWWNISESIMLQDNLRGGIVSGIVVAIAFCYFYIGYLQKNEI